MKKSTNKEIWILVLLLGILAVYGFYVLLLSPKISEAEELKLQVESEDTVVRTMYTSVLRYESDAEMVREAQTQAKELAEHFYVRSDQETYLDTLNQMLTEYTITFDTIEASEHEDMELMAEGYRCDSPYTAFLSAADLEVATPDDIYILLQTTLKEIDLPDVEEMVIRIDATGNYAAIQQLIEKVAAFDKYITCDTLNVEMISETEVVKEENPQVRVKMDLRFVRIVNTPCLDSEELFPELPADFVMPIDFISGDYKKLFSFSSISDWIRDLVG